MSAPGPVVFGAFELNPGSGERVVGGGFFCYPAMATDPWLDPLRKTAVFTRLLGQAKARHDDALAAFDRLGGNKVLAVAATVGS